MGREVPEEVCKHRGQLPWVTLHAEEGEGRDPMAERYGVMDLPTSLLVDRHGRVVELQACGAALNTLIDRLVGK
jgi:hypothetical protein